MLFYKSLKTDAEGKVFSKCPSFNLKTSRFFQSTAGDYSKWIEYKKQRKKVLAFSNYAFDNFNQNSRAHLKRSVTMSAITFKIPKDQLKSQNLLEVLNWLIEVI